MGRHTHELQFLNIQLVKNREALRAAAPWLSKDFRKAAVLVSEEFRQAEQRIFGPREAERLRGQQRALEDLGVQLGDVLQIHTASSRNVTFRLHGVAEVGRPRATDGMPQAYRLYGLALSAVPALREFESCIVNARQADASIKVIARAVGSNTPIDALMPERTPTFSSVMRDVDRTRWLEEPCQPNTEETLRSTLDALSDNGLVWAELASTRPEVQGPEDATCVLPVQKAVRVLFQESFRLRELLERERRRATLRVFLSIVPGQTLDVAEGTAAVPFRFEGIEQVGALIALKGRRLCANDAWAEHSTREFVDNPRRAREIVARSKGLRSDKVA